MSYNIPIYARYVPGTHKSLLERLEFRFICYCLVKFLASGSGSAFLIQIPIQKSQINAVPDPDSQYCFKPSLYVFFPRFDGTKPMCLHL